MPKFLGVVMDPIESINYHKDTSLALLLAAQRSGFQLFYMQQADLFIDNDGAKAKMRPLTVTADSNSWFDLGKTHIKPLADLDVILMRKDPPFDSEFIYSTYILEAAEQAGDDMSYSCRAGACSSCVGQILEGTVDQSDQSFLDDDQMEQGYSLLCVSYATSNLTLRTDCEQELW